jgi:hypothetical protein
VGAPIWQLVIQYHPAVDVAVEVRVVGLGDHLILYHLFWEVMKTWYEPDRTLAYVWEKIGEHSSREKRRSSLQVRWNSRTLLDVYLTLSTRRKASCLCFPSVVGFNDLC